MDGRSLTGFIAEEFPDGFKGTTPTPETHAVRVWDGQPGVSPLIGDVSFPLMALAGFLLIAAFLAVAARYEPELV